MLLSDGIMSLYLINSPSISLSTISVFPTMKDAFLLPRHILISSSSSSSETILLISFIIFADMIKLFSSLLCMFSLASASLNPSRATIDTLSLPISVRIPTSMPFASSILAANDVFFTISLNISLSNMRVFIISSLSLMFGNSSTGRLTTVNSDEFVFISILLSSVFSIIISSLGSFRIISPKSFDTTTAEPGS